MVKNLETIDQHKIKDSLDMSSNCSSGTLPFCHSFPRNWIKIETQKPARIYAPSPSSISLDMPCVHRPVTSLPVLEGSDKLRSELGLCAITSGNGHTGGSALMFTYKSPCIIESSSDEDDVDTSNNKNIKIVKVSDTRDGGHTRHNKYYRRTLLASHGREREHSSRTGTVTITVGCGRPSALSSFPEELLGGLLMCLTMIGYRTHSELALSSNAAIYGMLVQSIKGVLGAGGPSIAAVGVHLSRFGYEALLRYSNTNLLYYSPRHSSGSSTLPHANALQFLLDCGLSGAPLLPPPVESLTSMGPVHTVTALHERHAFVRWLQRALGPAIRGNGGLAAAAAVLSDQEHDGINSSDITDVIASNGLSIQLVTSGTPGFIQSGLLPIHSSFSSPMLSLTPTAMLGPVDRLSCPTTSWCIGDRKGNPNAHKDMEGYHNHPSSHHILRAKVQNNALVRLSRISDYIDEREMHPDDDPDESQSSCCYSINPKYLRETMLLSGPIAAPAVAALQLLHQRQRHRFITYDTKIHNPYNAHSHIGEHPSLDDCNTSDIMYGAQVDKGRESYYGTMCLHYFKLLLKRIFTPILDMSNSTDAFSSSDDEEDEICQIEDNSSTREVGNTLFDNHTDHIHYNNNASNDGCGDVSLHMLQSFKNHRDILAMMHDGVGFYSKDMSTDISSGKPKANRIQRQPKHIHNDRDLLEFYGGGCEFVAVYAGPSSVSQPAVRSAEGTDVITKDTFRHTITCGGMDEAGLVAATSGYYDITRLTHWDKVMMASLALGHGEYTKTKALYESIMTEVTNINDAERQEYNVCPKGDGAEGALLAALAVLENSENIKALDGFGSENSNSDNDDNIASSTCEGQNNKPFNRNIINTTRDNLPSSAPLSGSNKHVVDGYIVAGVKTGAVGGGTHRGHLPGKSFDFVVLSSTTTTRIDNVCRSANATTAVYGFPSISNSTRKSPARVFLDSVFAAAPSTDNILPLTDPTGIDIVDDDMSLEGIVCGGTLMAKSAPETVGCGMTCVCCNGDNTNPVNLPFGSHDVVEIAVQVLGADVLCDDRVISVVGEVISILKNINGHVCSPTTSFGEKRSLINFVRALLPVCRRTMLVSLPEQELTEMKSLDMAEFKRSISAITSQLKSDAKGRAAQRNKYVAEERKKRKENDKSMKKQEQFEQQATDFYTNKYEDEIKNTDNKNDIYNELDAYLDYTLVDGVLSKEDANMNLERLMALINISSAVRYVVDPRTHGTPLSADPDKDMRRIARVICADKGRQSHQGENGSYKHRMIDSNDTPHAAAVLHKHRHLCPRSALLELSALRYRLSKLYHILHDYEEKMLNGCRGDILISNASTTFPSFGFSGAIGKNTNNNEHCTVHQNKSGRMTKAEIWEAAKQITVSAILRGYAQASLAKSSASHNNSEGIVTCNLSPAVKACIEAYSAYRLYYKLRERERFLALLVMERPADIAVIANVSKSASKQKPTNKNTKNSTCCNKKSKEVDVLQLTREFSSSPCSTTDIINELARFSCAFGHESSKGGTLNVRTNNKTYGDTVVTRAQIESRSVYHYCRPAMTNTPHSPNTTHIHQAPPPEMLAELYHSICHNYTSGSIPISQTLITAERLLATNCILSAERDGTVAVSSAQGYNGFICSSISRCDLIGSGSPVLYPITPTLPTWTPADVQPSPTQPLFTPPLFDIYRNCRQMAQCHNRVFVVDNGQHYSVLEVRSTSSDATTIPIYALDQQRTDVDIESNSDMDKMSIVVSPRMLPEYLHRMCAGINTIITAARDNNDDVSSLLPMMGEGNTLAVLKAKLDSTNFGMDNHKRHFPAHNSINNTFMCALSFVKKTEDNEAMCLAGDEAIAVITGKPRAIRPLGRERYTDVANLVAREAMSAKVMMQLTIGTCWSRQVGEGLY